MKSADDKLFPTALGVVEIHSTRIFSYYVVASFIWLEISAGWKYRPTEDIVWLEISETAVRVS